MASAPEVEVGAQMLSGATVSSGAVGADVPGVVVVGATVLGVDGAPVIGVMVGIASSSLFVEGAGVRPVATGAVMKGAKVPKVARKVALSVVQEMGLFVRADDWGGVIILRLHHLSINTIN